MSEERHAATAEVQRLAAQNERLRRDVEELRQALAAAREARSKEAKLNLYLSRANSLLDRQLFEKTVVSKVLELSESGEDLEQFCRGLFELIGELVRVSWVGIRLSRQGHTSIFQAPADHPHGVAMLEGMSAGRFPAGKQPDEVFVYRLGRGDAAFGHLMCLAEPGGWSEEDRDLLAAVCHEASPTLEHNLLIRLLKEMAGFQADFVNMLSHDLRNPLTGVISSLSTLLVPGLPLGEEDRNALIRTAFDSANVVNEMISDLLDVAKMEAGRMVLPREAVDLAAVARKSLEPLHAVARARRLSLELVAEPGLPPVPGDAKKLGRVFANLVANALKYTRKGGVAVVMRAQADHVEVAVSDTGLGIAPEAQTRLFEKFYQVADRERSHAGGTGLGLAYCRQMIEAHGGAIWVESPNEGSSERRRLPDSDAPGATFRFTLPLLRD